MPLFRSAVPFSGREEPGLDDSEADAYFKTLKRRNDKEFILAGLLLIIAGSPALTAVSCHRNGVRVAPAEKPEPKE